MAEAPKVGRNRGNAGKGRPKGSPNKTTALLKDAILQAAEQAGGDTDETGPGGLVGYLVKQATANPGPFLTLLGKVLPMQISTPPGEPLQMDVTGAAVLAALARKHDAE